MIIERQEDVTPAVLKELSRAPNARFKEVMGAFIRHMHDFVRDSRLTEEEFRTAMNYVVALGKASNESHNEAVLIAGSLGISSLVCLLNNSDGQTDTDASLLGPFWREQSPVTPNGGSIIRYPTPGPALFVKVVVREWRDGDLLWRSWRRLTRRSQRRPVRVGSPHHEVEHEASMALLAATAGVRVPRVLLVRSFDSGAGMLVQARVAGRDLQQLEADLVEDTLLTELWRQVALLHRAGIAHGELVPANCMVDGDGRPWLVDYDQAQAASGTALLERDRAELLAALSAMVGPERAKRTSEATLV